MAILIQYSKDDVHVTARIINAELHQEIRDKIKTSWDRREAYLATVAKDT